MKFNWTQFAIALGLFLLGYLTFNSPWFKGREESKPAAPAAVAPAGNAGTPASPPAPASR